jgi:hypothetical protein
MLLKKTLLLLLLFNFIIYKIYSQGMVSVYGRITDSESYPISLVNISVPDYNIGTVSDKYGNYEIKIPFNKKTLIVYSCVGYKQFKYEYFPTDEQKIKVDIVLYTEAQEIEEISITSRKDNTSNYVRIDSKAFDFLPNTSGNIETIIKTLPGVKSGNELSSQYSVRGGNYDENLVYVNGIEVYRPLLVKSGQQEGLSFINSDLVSSIKFSAGGFEARYGDKMSSVLDIQYKKPTSQAASFSASLLGATAHFEGISENKKFTHITGIRYKANQYLLKSLDTKGEYKPKFGDFQTYLTYHFNDKTEISFLGNISQNIYFFIPEFEKTSFGTFGNPLQLNIYYDGKELDKFNTYFGAVNLNLKPNDNLILNFTASLFKTDEQETYDIQGQYFINYLNTRIEDRTSDSLANIGIGTFLNHARNYLNAKVLAICHNGIFISENKKTYWGIQYQTENISDEINEWRMVDSAGYSIPYPNPFTRSQIQLEEQFNNKSNMNNYRLMSYVQNVYSINEEKYNIDLIIGTRFHYWSFNKEVLFSPRASISFKPEWKRDIIFYFSTGIYYQPPFFKEIRDSKGNINYNIKAQRAVHYVLTADYLFSLWNRPFKWVTEVYYKSLDNIIPYKINNLQIKYSAKNNAVGFARGIDIKINGEFVKGMESWASISLMRTKEDIINDYYYNDSMQLIKPGYYRRPTDQLFSFNLFFQDYLPNNPSYKASVNFVFGTRMPFTSTNSERYDEGVQANLKAYKRVDIGFSKILKRENKIYDNKYLDKIKSAWLSVEIFNLFGIKNEASLSWIKTLSDRSGSVKEFIVPNHLTGRLFNLKLSVKL